MVSDQGFDFDGTWRVNIPPSVIYRNLGDEAVALNLQTGRYYGLDAVGTCFWEMLVKSTSIAVVQQELLTRFDVDEQTLKKDFARFLDDLAKHGLIEISKA